MILITITSSDGPPYKSGDTLTCAAEIYDKGDDTDIPTYVWVGTNGGSEVSFYRYFNSSYSSSTSTVTLLSGEFCMYCIARFEARMSNEWQPDHCSASASVCDSATGK